jgi:hypothetical protein
VRRSPGTTPTKRHIDWERQADKALELTPETDIRFIRLVQLVGG